MSEKELLVISRKTYLVGVWTIVITVFLALAGGAVGVTYSMGRWTERIEHTEKVVSDHEQRLGTIEKYANTTQRVLDRLEFNLKNDIVRRGGVYTEIDE